MGKHTIEKNDLSYRLFYSYIQKLHNLFYREVYSINVPDKQQEKPSIITPNHQNALMDAMAILFAKNDPLVFLARSDIFKKKRIATFLYYLKILPVYRIRDGYDSLKNNQETFDHTVRVLKNKRGLVILPEGNHFGAKKLRQLKKGFARIAFQTELNSNDPIDLEIIPTAIDYTNYSSFFARLTVVFGTPFPLKPYLEEYKENPQIALAKITKDLSEKLKNQIIHIESEEHYDECLAASAIYAENSAKSLTNKGQEIRFSTQRKVTQALNMGQENAKELYTTIISNTQNILKHTKKLPFEIIGRKSSTRAIIAFILTLLLVPFALPGTIVFGVFWLWPIIFTNKKIKDVQFRTSIRYVIYIVQFGLILIAALITFLSLFTLKTAALLFISTIISGVLSIKIWHLVRWSFLRAKWAMVQFQNKEIRINIQDLHNAISELLKNVS
ncbi:MAG: 1-acyl-sn-glycerol-3-phosphate acyltransferase [Salinivirgaceae bacterium]|jgi:1-acyl-sn-glycerol-3-phosphate acyltransferase|nr:1-acyl-sn-glycerol-3-phosphate acyltransferase [Salinivirgaceae bacterium]